MGTFRVVILVTVIDIGAGVLLVLLAQHLSAEVDKDFLNVGPRSGASLIVGRAPSLRDGKALGSGHSTVLLQVGLISNYDDGDVLVILDSNDLFSKTSEFVQR